MAIKKTETKGNTKTTKDDTKKEDTTMAADKLERNAKQKKSKGERFKELAQIRVNKAIKQLGMVSNLSDSSKFEYSIDDAEKIKEALQEALDNVVERFESSDEDVSSFTL